MRNCFLALFTFVIGINSQAVPRAVSSSTSPSLKATITPTPTPSPKAAATPTPSAIVIPKASVTPTPTASPKATATPTPTASPKGSNTPLPKTSPVVFKEPNPPIQPVFCISRGLLNGLREAKALPIRSNTPPLSAVQQGVALLTAVAAGERSLALAVTQIQPYLQRISRVPNFQVQFCENDALPNSDCMVVEAAQAANYPNHQAVGYSAEATQSCARNGMALIGDKKYLAVIATTNRIPQNSANRARDFMQAPGATTYVGFQNFVSNGMESKRAELYAIAIAARQAPNFAMVDPRQASDAALNMVITNAQAPYWTVVSDYQRASYQEINPGLYRRLTFIELTPPSALPVLLCKDSVDNRFKVNGLSDRYNFCKDRPNDATCLDDLSIMRRVGIGNLAPTACPMPRP